MKTGSTTTKKSLFLFSTCRSARSPSSEASLARTHGYPLRHVQRRLTRPGAWIRSCLNKQATWPHMEALGYRLGARECHHWILWTPLFVPACTCVTLSSLSVVDGRIFHSESGFGVVDRRAQLLHTIRFLISHPHSLSSSLHHTFPTVDPFANDLFRLLSGWVSLLPRASPQAQGIRSTPLHQHRVMETPPT